VPRTKGQDHQRFVWAQTFGEPFAPDTCPWRSYQDPLVREAVDVFAEIGGFTEAGANIVTYLLLDPPHVLLEGIRSMRRAVSAMRRQAQHKRNEELTRMQRKR
jgi:hypothetical protein